MNILKIFCDCVVYLHAKFFDLVEVSLRLLHRINYPDDPVCDSDEEENAFIKKFD